ncbi:hypothetical protein H0H81_009780 [Sphagnurus paluster]|uniref:Uncharacterized protein n=1 Tax=Sphagnurus paluster TaxID=117069 RepID=A0A9P7K4G8_9AGAR|nr:hypothetical protein H0H81_009780 [Sphagnurus paluster]
MLIYDYVVVPAKLDKYIFEPITHFLFLAGKQYFTSPTLITMSLVPWVGGAIYDHIIVPRFLNPTPKFVFDEKLPVDDSPHPTHLPVKIEAEKLDPEIETCPFVISMKVGKEWSVPPSMNIGITPTQEIYLMANWVKSKAIIPQYRFLSVHAELGNAPGLYSVVDGYRELGQHIASLGRKVPFERWGKLTICLPTELSEIEYPSSSYEVPPIPTDQLRNLHWLTWSGRREQLVSPSSWLLFSVPLLRPLISLTLTCQISLDDLSRILYCAVQLQTLEVHSISATADSLLTNLPGGLSSFRLEERPNLEALTLTSSHDISSVFSKYSLPGLRIIDFDFSYSESIRKAGIPWNQLASVTLKCYFEGRHDSDWIRQQCPVHARHMHTHIEVVHEGEGIEPALCNIST